ncbi:MAG: ATP phosphoribosyltransferase [Deltaproteobacteria bacterium]|nr:ATP phosphoribosyltransferase [Deltaproteobacteria bacterium]
MKETLTIALPKGRIQKDTEKIFSNAGITIPKKENSDDRRLIFENKEDNLRFMIVRAQDVPTYIEFGAADIGIAGSDVLIEQGRDLYEPLDLKIGKCRLSVAEPVELKKSDNPGNWTHIRVATKYPNITKKYFSDKGIQTELIKLYGSIELAPILGLSERIVDLVETGETMRQNGLIEVETIMEVSSRLIVNRASLKTKPKRVKSLVEKLSKVI